MKEKVYCYFHNDDMDGWSSSAVVQMKHQNAEFCGYNYDDDVSLVKGYDIAYMVDCSMPDKDMKFLMKNNKKFVWIDHHAKKIWDTYENLGKDIDGLRDTGSKNSACVLTWKYFFPNKRVPYVLTIIEDMDLWKWQQNFTDEINATLFYLHKNRKDIIYFIENWNEVWGRLIDNGKVLLSMRDAEVDFLSSLVKKGTFDGYKTGYVNSPIHQSHIGHKILKDNPDVDIAYVWYHKPDTDMIKVSLRSRKIDVGKIAHNHGGGGHKLASGFHFKANGLNLEKIENYKK